MHEEQQFGAVRRGVALASRGKQSILQNMDINDWKQKPQNDVRNQQRPRRQLSHVAGTFLAEGA